MLKETDADIVIISTDWDTHGIMAIESMKNNMHAFVEVPLATTIKDLWEIVNTSEKLVSSKVVIPLEIEPKSSPITSERINPCTLAG